MKMTESAAALAASILFAIVGLTGCKKQSQQVVANSPPAAVKTASPAQSPAAADTSAAAAEQEATPHQASDTQAQAPVSTPDPEPATSPADIRERKLAKELISLTPATVMERCGAPDGDVPKRISVNGEFHKERILIYTGGQNGAVGVEWIQMFPSNPHMMLTSVQVIRNHEVAENYEVSFVNLDWVDGFLSSLPCLAK